jgi:hypothetical protein
MVSALSHCQMSVMVCCLRHNLIEAIDALMCSVMHDIVHAWIFGTKLADVLILFLCTIITLTLWQRNPVVSRPPAAYGMHLGLGFCTLASHILDVTRRENIARFSSQ